jgi:hypothetical protein
MAIGIQQSRATEDEALGRIARSLESVMAAIDQHTDSTGNNPTQAQFTAAPFNYTASEADDVVAMLNDLILLKQIYRGNVTLPAVRQFRNSIKKALGPGFF